MAETKKLTVRELAQSVTRDEVTFAEFDARAGSPYAVEGNDVSGYKGVSSEYRTYASKVDAPLAGAPDEDANSQDESDTPESEDAPSISSDSPRGPAF